MLVGGTVCGGKIGLFNIIRVLARVRRLVLQPLEDTVHPKRQSGTHKRTQPEDPMDAHKPRDDGWAERSSRVDGGARVVCTSNVCQEGRDTNTNGRQVRGAMFLHGEEIYGDDELGGEEHLEEETLGCAGAVAELVGDAEGTGEEAVCHGGGGNGGDELGWEDEQGTNRFDGADEDQAECDLIDGTVSHRTTHMPNKGTRSNSPPD